MNDTDECGYCDDPHQKGDPSDPGIWGSLNVIAREAGIDTEEACLCHECPVCCYRRLKMALRNLESQISINKMSTKALAFYGDGSAIKAVRKALRENRQK